jgi:hypothetical protein
MILKIQVEGGFRFMVEASGRQASAENVVKILRAAFELTRADAALRWISPPASTIWRTPCCQTPGKSG